MIEPATILDQAGEALGGFLPRLGGALVLVVVGVLVAKLLGRLVARALAGAGLDRAADRWGTAEILERAGVRAPLSRLIGGALRLGITVVVIFAALSLLGLQFLSESLNAGVLLLPKLLVAAILLLAGLVLGALVRERVDRLTFQMGLPAPLGGLAQAAVIAVFAITAAAQVAVSTALLLILVAILLAAAVGMVALAFGLGGRDVAREFSAGRTLRGVYAEGQEVSLPAATGTVREVANAVTVIETADGVVNVPNSVVLGSVVRISQDAGEPSASEPPAPERPPAAPGRPPEDSPGPG